MRIRSGVKVKRSGELHTANGTNVPPELAGYLSDFENWASVYHEDSKRDLILLWMLKMPAIIALAAAGVLATFDQKIVSLALGMLASVCVLIDGLQPRGALRNAHLRAAHDIRSLTNGLLSNWRARDRSESAEKIIRDLISNAEPERLRIVQYVRDAETNLSSSTRQK